MAKSFIDLTPAELGFSSNDNGALGITTKAPKFIPDDDLGFSSEDQDLLGIKAKPANYGAVEKGNINLSIKPPVTNADGTISTIRSIGINDGGLEVVIPTVINGRVVADSEAIEHYKKTGEHLGKFKTIQEANSFGQLLHDEEQNRVNYQPKPEDIKIDLPQPIGTGPYGEDIARRQAAEKQNVELYGEAMPRGTDPLRPAAAMALNIASLVPQAPGIIAKAAKGDPANVAKYEAYLDNLDATADTPQKKADAERIRREYENSKRVVSGMKAAVSPAKKPAAALTKKIQDAADAFATLPEQAADIRKDIAAISASKPEFADDLLNSAKLGKLDLQLDWFAAQAAARGDQASVDEMKRLSADYRKAQEGEQKYGIVREALKGVARMAPGLVGSMAVSAIPVVGVPAAFTGWAAQGMGEVYSEAVSKGAAPDNALFSSLVAAPIYSGIEFIQIGKLKRVPEIKNALTKAILEYGFDLGKEVNEEGLQGVTNYLAEQMAVGNKDVGALAKGAWDVYLDNVKQSALSLAIVGAPAKAAGYIGGRSSAPPAQLPPTTGVPPLPQPPSAPDDTPAQQPAPAASARGRLSPVAGVPAASSPQIPTEPQVAPVPAEAAPEPSQAQKEAGNYKKEHVRRDGMDISIENPAGSIRSGTDTDGETWSQKMNHDYGYIKGTVGKDKDHVDVFIKPGSQEGGPIFVVDQVNKAGKFDEHKVMMGFNSMAEARDAYLSNYEAGWQGLGAITEMPMDQFKEWAYKKDKKGPLGGSPGFNELRNIPPTEKAIGVPPPGIRSVLEKPGQEKTLLDFNVPNERAYFDLPEEKRNNIYPQPSKADRNRLDTYVEPLPAMPDFSPGVESATQREPEVRQDGEKVQAEAQVAVQAEERKRDGGPQSTPAPITDQQKEEVDKLIDSGYIHLTVVSHGKDRLYKLHDIVGNARYFKADTDIVDYIKYALPKIKMPLQTVNRLNTEPTEEQKKQIDQLINSGYKYSKLVMRQIGKGKGVGQRQVWKIYNDLGQEQLLPASQTGVMNYFRSKAGKNEAPAFRMAGPARETETLTEEEIGRLPEDLRTKISAIQERSRRSETEAITDPLTGAMTRRGLDRLNIDLKNHAVVMIDADKFKDVNDTHGHPVGDEVLKSIADILKKHFDGVAHVVRMGGEEFGIFPLQNSINQGILNKTAAANKELSLRSFAGGKLTGMTFSAGAAQAGTDVSNTIDEADRQLYLAKEDGRARTKFKGRTHGETATDRSTKPQELERGRTVEQPKSQDEVRIRDTSETKEPESGTKQPESGTKMVRPRGPRTRRAFDAAYPRRDGVEYSEEYNRNRFYASFASDTYLALKNGWKDRNGTFHNGSWPGWFFDYLTLSDRKGKPKQALRHQVTDNAIAYMQDIVDRFRENEDSTEALREIGIDPPDHYDDIRSWLEQSMPSAEAPYQKNQWKSYHDSYHLKEKEDDQEDIDAEERAYYENVRQPESVPDAIQAGKDLADELSSSFGVDLGVDDVQVVIPNDEERLFQEAFVAVLGPDRGPYFARFSSKTEVAVGGGFNGVTLPNGKVFININADRPVSNVLAHETMHTMAVDNPIGFRGFMDFVDKNLTELGERAVDARFKGENLKNRRTALEEIAGDILDDNISNPRFWKLLYAKSPRIVQNLLDAMKKVYDRFLSSASHMKLTDKAWFKDVGAIRRELAKFTADTIAIKQGKLTADRVFSTDNTMFQHKEAKRAKAVGLENIEYEEGTPEQETRGRDIERDLGNVQFLGIQTGIRGLQAPFMQFQVIDDAGEQHGNITAPLDASTADVARYRERKIRQIPAFQFKEVPMDLETAREMAQSNGLEYVTSTPAKGGPAYTFRDPRTGTEFQAKTRGEVRQAVGDLADRVAPRGTVKAGEGVRFQRKGKSQTDTPEFKRWFGGSKVVDDQGKPLVVYHGTAGDRTVFDLKMKGSSAGGVGTDSGFFFTDNMDNAKTYAIRAIDMLDEESPTLVEVYLKIKNPIIVDIEKEYQEEYKNVPGLPNPEDIDIGEMNKILFPEGAGAYTGFLEQIIETAEKNKNDGVIVKNIIDNYTLDNGSIKRYKVDTYSADLPATHYVIFSPTQIKSATGNRGTFDPENPDIRFQRKGQPAVNAEQYDVFGGSKTTQDLEREETQKLQRAEIRNRQEARRGGEADMSGLPMFENQDIEGSQQTLMFQRQKADTFFSPVFKAVQALKQERGTGDQMFAMITKTPGVKEAEWKWMGLDDFLRGKPSVTKAEIEDFVRQNQVRVEEKQLGIGKGKRLSFDDAEKIVKNGHMVLDEDGSIVSTPGQLNRYPRKTSFRKMAASAEYSQYTLPGGENYREVLLKLPFTKFEQEFSVKEKRPGEWIIVDGNNNQAIGTGGYKDEKFANEMLEMMNGRLEPKGYESSHWSEPNVIAHVRLNDRTGPNGEKVLFVEEIQSDWAREAREKGIQSEDKTKEMIAQLKAERNSLGEWKVTDNQGRIWSSDFQTEKEAMDEAKNRVINQAGGIGPRLGVPAQPFLKNWEELTLKRVLRMAAEEGYDRVAWINGEQTAARYDLSKQIDRVVVEKFKDKADVYVYDKNGAKAFEEIGVPINEERGQKRLSELLGKDLSKKIIDDYQTLSGREQKEYSGVDLKIGGEWATNLYDRMIPKFLEKYGKRWGTKVENIDFGPDPSGAPTKKYADYMDAMAEKYEFFGPWGVLMNKMSEPEKRQANQLRDAQPATDGPGVQQSVAITPAMRESVLYEGQPMFQKRKKPPKIGEVDYTPKLAPQIPEEERARARQSQERAREMQDEISSLRGQRAFKTLPDGTVKLRAEIELRMKMKETELSDQEADLVRTQIYDYAKALGLRGLPYNQVDTMLKNSRTAGDLRKAIDRLDYIWEMATRREAVKDLYALIDKKYKKLRALVATRRPPTTDIENNRRLREYLDNLIGLNKTEDKDHINKMLAWMQREGPRNVRDKELYEMPESVRDYVEGKVTDIPESMSNAVRGMFKDQIETMPVSRIKQIIADIESIEETGQTKKEILDQETKDRRGKESGAIAAEIGAQARKKPQDPRERASTEEGYGEARKRRKSPGEQIDAWMWEMRDIDRISVALTGKTKNTAFERFFVRPLAEAYSKWKMNMRSAEAFMKGNYGALDIAKARHDKGFGTINKLVYEFNDDGSYKMADDGRRVSAIAEFPITLEEAIFVYAHSLNGTSREHLMASINPEDREFASSQIAGIVATIPADWKKAVERQWKYFADVQWDQMNAPFAEIHQIDMDKEDNYFPCNNLDNAFNDETIEVDLLARATGQAAVRAGATESRVVGGRDKGHVGASPFRHFRYFDVLIKNMYQAAHYNAMALPVREAQKIISNNAVRAGIDRISRNARPVIMDWLKSLAYGKWSYGERDGAFESLLRGLRRNAGSYQILGRATSVLVQISSLPRGFIGTGKKYLVGAVASMAKHPITLIKAIDEKSPNMAARSREYEQAISEFMESEDGKRLTKTLGAIDRARLFFGEIIGGVDKLYASITWYARYSEAKDKGADERTSIYEADKTVRKTQSGGGLFAATGMQRGPEGRRIFTQFMSDAIKATNLLDELVHGWNSLPTAEKANYILWGMVFPAILTQFVRTGFEPWREPEETLKEFLLQSFYSIPIAGQVAEVLVNVGMDWIKQRRGIITKRGWQEYAGQFEAPAAQLVEDATKDFLALVDVKKWRTDAQKTLLKGFDLAAILAGIPAGGQLKRIAGGWDDFRKTHDFRYFLISKTRLEEGNKKFLLHSPERINYEKEMTFLEKQQTAALEKGDNTKAARIEKQKKEYSAKHLQNVIKAERTFVNNRRRNKE